jgi:hypothetical protein
MGHSGQHSGKGIGIFYLVLVFFPLLGWFFGFLNWIIEHILWIFIGLVIWFFYNVWKDYKKDMEEQKNA